MSTIKGRAVHVHAPLVSTLVKAEVGEHELRYVMSEREARLVIGSRVLARIDAA